ncbi:hypothetical protein [Yoonia sp.]|jgi:hypothetical protein|uniref:hypothetical protein n=1 Tax=Yoonia sp. TaxID=2212373 RepID=UPI0025E359E5|nr:hypothetical protein [Yoonia sp.]
MYFGLATAIRSIVAAFVLVAGATVTAQPALLMAEEPGCIWCARWNAEVAPIYGRTGEGAAVPLRRMNVTQPTPADVTLVRAVNFTPTFILLQDGQELSRIEGYPGQDFFWGLLGTMLKQHDIPFELKIATPEPQL